MEGGLVKKEEVANALQKMKYSKAVGVDGTAFGLS